MLASSGTGQFGAAVFERVTDTLVPEASANVRTQLVEQLQAANLQVPPTGVKTLGTPVVAHTVDLVPKIKVEVVVSDAALQAAVDAVLRAAKTGEIGDGKIFVVPVESVIRIRTGEKGEQAI